jgi:hypothetical protein
MPAYAGNLIDYMHMKDGRGFLRQNDCLDTPMRASMRRPSSPDYWIACVKCQLLQNNMSILAFLKAIRRGDPSTPR